MSPRSSLRRSGKGAIDTVHTISSITWERALLSFWWLAPHEKICHIFFLNKTLKPFLYGMMGLGMMRTLENRYEKQVMRDKRHK
jgi:hypothetical protein